MQITRLEIVEGEEKMVTREEHSWEKIARLAAADVKGLTYFVKDKVTKKEKPISGEDYWIQVKAKEAAKPKRKPNKAVVQDPIVRKIEKINGIVTERRVKQSVLDAEKRAATLLTNTTEHVTGAARIGGYTKYMSNKMIAVIVGVLVVIVVLVRRGKR